MERVALHVQARDCSIYEAEVEAGVMPHQNRTFAAIGFQGFANTTEDVGQRSFFADSHAQRVIELDPGELQRGSFDIGAFERFNAVEVSVLREHEAFFVHADRDCGDFQQRIGRRVESAGFYVDNDRQIAAETGSHRVPRAASASAAMTVLFVVEMIFAHACSSSRRQRSFSPARSGITDSVPNGRLVGAVHSSRTSVMVSRLGARP